VPALPPWAEFDVEDMAAATDKVGSYHATEAYKKEIRKRQVWMEPLFAEAKEWHSLRCRQPTSC